MSERFIGIDLTDPYAKRKRDITVVEFRPDDFGLRGELVQLPNLTWPPPPRWARDAFDLSSGTELPDGWPTSRAGERLWVAIDGPQGLAGPAHATSRECERQTGAPGKTPHAYPRSDRPFAGFVTGSVVLWSHLTGFVFPNATVDGLGESDPDSNLHLCEMYPGVTWSTLLPNRRMPPKHEREGKLARFELLRQYGVRLDEKHLAARDADDVLDAGLGALIAYWWKLGLAGRYGSPPFHDPLTHTLREGFIRSMNWEQHPAGMNLNLDEIDRLTDAFRRRRALQVSSIKTEGIIPLNLELIEAEASLQSHPDAELLCLCDNGGIWENHHPWLAGLDPDVILQAVDNGELITLTPANSEKHWKSSPTTLSLATNRRFPGCVLSKKEPEGSLMMFVRIVDWGC